MWSLPELLIAHRVCVQNKIKECVYSSGFHPGLVCMAPLEPKTLLIESTMPQSLSNTLIHLIL